MSLIQCRECGATVSKNAMACPNCGLSVIMLEQRGCHCSNCECQGYDPDDCSTGTGYPCLAWREDDNCD